MKYQLMGCALEDEMSHNVVCMNKNVEHILMGYEKQEDKISPDGVCTE